MEISNDDLQICKEIMDREFYHYIDEEFRYITYPGVRPYAYVISSYGNVISLLSKQLLKPFDNNGYDRIRLSGEEMGSNIKIRVHRLVAWEYCIGYDPENGVDVVNHIDYNRRNNHKNNLEWCTTSYNNSHTSNNENYHSSQRKFNVDDVKYICELYSEGYIPKDVFVTVTGYNSTSQDESTYLTLKNIYNRKTYKNISKNYDWDIKHVDLQQRKFDDETVKQICKWFVEGYSVKDVYDKLYGEEYNKSNHVIIIDIFKRKSYKHISNNYDW